MSNQVLDKIKDIQKELNELEVKKDLPQSQRVIASIVRLLDDSVSVDDQSLFQLFTDSDGKIRANASWFYEDSVMTDRKATYKVHPQNNLNLDIKLYGITKPSKRTIAWAQSLTPNFEDEPFNKNFNVGIDFIVPKSADRIIVVLSNNWVIRTLELKGKLTVTFQEILARWAEIKNFDNKTELHNILWESFDIQPLNKKFYSGISERFTLLRQYLVKEKVFDEKHASLFANRLLGRVIFCWFLDKKGIINPDQKYFDSESFDNDNEYYRNKLERLFFGVLNTPIGDREFKDDVTPFLNGGLFEARKNDLYNDSKLSFPKNYFDDLFEFLSGYNFTTDESTSQFQQVAIDPEMLGRIFENLLAEMTEETGEQARKAKGAFYTPREIVDYMCKESLKEYLKTKIEKDEQLDQRLYQLIDAPDKDFQDQDHNWRRDWKPYKADILKALDELKVLDPACGSGAFPIGMLQLLVRVYERLEARFDSYKTKLGIIEKNIYGVDIEPMAVEIARLRAWLSIIVDEESDSKKIKPLPNLEFKFICANSLIDLDKSGNNTFGDDPELQEKLASIRDAYFNTESLNKKKKLRTEYEKLVTQGEGLFGESKKSKQLKTYRPFDNEAQAEFFDPKFMFGVVFFDIVIANPPYIDSEGMVNNGQSDLRDLIQQNYKWTKGNWDIYIAFFELGFRCASKEGVLVYITPDKWISKSFGDELRRGVIDNIFSILKSGRNVFETAKVDSIITFISKKKHDQIKVVEYTSNGFQHKRDYPKNKLNDPYALDFIFSENLELIEKLEKFTESISDYAICENACATSDAYKLKPLLQNIKDEDYDFNKYFKIINTGTISKYFSRWCKKEMTYLKDKYLCPVVNKEDFLKEFSNSYSQKSIKPKIIIKGLNLLDGTLDLYGDTIPAKTTLILTSESLDDLKFLLALINNDLTLFYLKEKYPASSYNQGITFTKDMINNFPIPAIDNKKKQQVISLVDQILNITFAPDFVDSPESRADIQIITNQLNDLFTNMYGLEVEEADMIYKKL